MIDYHIFKIVKIQNRKMVKTKNYKIIKYKNCVFI